jgi:hypothetical protein
VDTLLENNGEYAMAEEIETELTGGNVDKHLEWIEAGTGTIGQARGPEEAGLRGCRDGAN